MLSSINFPSGKYSHPNIVRLVDICHGERNPGDREMVLYLVFEHMDQVSWMGMSVYPPVSGFKFQCTITCFRTWQSTWNDALDLDWPLTGSKT